MKKNNILLVILVAFFSTNAISQTISSIKVLQNKHIKALGGIGVINSIKSLKITQQIAQGTYLLSNDLIIINKEKLYSKIKGPAGVVKVVVNGESGWQINPFLGINKATKMSTAELNVWSNQTNLIDALVTMENTGTTASILRKEIVNQVECEVVSLTYKSGYKVIFYISTKDFLILRSKDDKVEMNYFDYQSVNGFKFPFTTKVKNSMGEITYNVFKLEINPKIDNDIFEFPKK